MIGFFPTPYPDECLYSILCRYCARCGGAAYEKLSQMLFGLGLWTDRKRQNPTATIYLPIRAECIDSWVLPESGITRAGIAVNHTMCAYFAMTYGMGLRNEITSALNGGVTDLKHDRTMVHKSKRSWLRYLRYCPLCVAENIAVYGETYWHRKHQLPGSYYCTKHQVRLCNSRISIKLTATGFYPASNETQIDDVVTITADIFDRYKSS
jgi:hypothetical protein